METVSFFINEMIFAKDDVYSKYTFDLFFFKMSKISEKKMIDALCLFCYRLVASASVHFRLFACLTRRQNQ